MQKEQLSRQCMRHCEDVNREMGRGPNPIEKAEEVIKRMDADNGMIFNSGSLSEEEYAELLEDLMMRMT